MLTSLFTFALVSLATCFAVGNCVSEDAEYARYVRTHEGAR